MRKVIGSLLVVGAVITILLAEDLFKLGVESTFSWTFSKILPWLIVLITSVLGTYLIFKSLNQKRLKVVLFILIPLAFLGGMFAINPIYTGDYIKKGVELNISSHEFIDVVEKHKEGFDGIIAVVDYNCPFCRMATEGTLKTIKDRDVGIDMALTLNTADSATIQDYSSETNSENLEYLSHKPSSKLVELTNGVFPTFLYIKEGKILHKWKNSELGYPALDWIESGLK